MSDAPTQQESAPDAEQDRWARVADGFTRVVLAVPDRAWDRPAPCEGWVARDVVDHLVTWVPAVLAGASLDFDDPGPDAAPALRWQRFRDTISHSLADPGVAAREFDAGPPGTMTVRTAIAHLVLGDVLVHTWDLAVATGQQVQLEPDVVSDMYAGMLPMDEMLRASGHYGPRVDVADDADDTTRLLAFTGRDVHAWS